MTDIESTRKFVQKRTFFAIFVIFMSICCGSASWPMANKVPDKYDADTLVHAEKMNVFERCGET